MYTVVILMREKGTHATFLPAFRQFTDEVLELHRKGALNSISIGTCWLERNDVPAHFQALTNFGIDNGLIKDGAPVADFPPLDESVVEKFYLRLQGGMIAHAVDEARDALSQAAGLMHEAHTLLKSRGQ